MSFSLLEILERELVKHYFMINVVKNELRRVFPNVDIVHVGELVQCRLKVLALSQIGSEEEYFKAIRGRKVTPMFLGTIVEHGFRNIVKGRVKVLDHVIKFKKLTLPDMKNVVIVGSPDLVVEVDGKYIPVEVKWSISQAELREHYEVQAKLYAWLFDSEEARVVVFSPNGFAEYRVEAFSDKEVEQIYADWLKKTPRWEWECRYCSAAHTCTARTQEKREQTTAKTIKTLT